MTGMEDGPAAGGEVEIVAMRRADWPRVAEIYAEGIATGGATFETEVPPWGRWDAAHLPAPRLVARIGGRIMGWAAVARVSDREVYKGRVECSLYIAAEARGMGVGEALMTALTAQADRAGLWTLEAVVFPDNTASIKMLEASGFRVVGRRERLGRRDGRWRDVLLLERRGPVV
jgi:phosphinothricin acetyltransferase